MKCEACGKDGTLDIRATVIRCSFCDGEWGRVNGFWVESKSPRCMECGGDGKTIEADPQICPSCAGTGREGGVNGGDRAIFPPPPGRCSPLPHGSVFGTDAVCMPPVSAEPYRGIGRIGDCDCADDFTCAEHGGGHVLRDHK
jgi:phage FluMu protein Com